MVLAERVIALALDGRTKACALFRSEVLEGRHWGSIDALLQQELEEFKNWDCLPQLIPGLRTVLMAEQLQVSAALGDAKDGAESFQRMLAAEFNLVKNWYSDLSARVNASEEEGKKLELNKKEELRKHALKYAFGEGGEAKSKISAFHCSLFGV